MIKKYLETGKIVGTHGVRGEMRVQPWCDSADFLKKFKKLYLDDKGTETLSVRSCRPHGNVVILKVDGVDTVEEAMKLREKVIFIKREDAKIPKGSYFVAELIDCRVIDADDETKTYGILTDVSQTGANDVWHITAENEEEYLIPAIPDVVINTDVEQGIIKIRPMRGIFDDED